MASGEGASEPINSKISELKVSIHCEGCKKKIFRILRKVEGIELIDVDAKQNKVTVKAPVDAQTLIQRLKKSGKHAELWPHQNPHQHTHHPSQKKNHTKDVESEKQKESSQKPAPAVAKEAKIEVTNKSIVQAPEVAKAESEHKNSTGKDQEKKVDDKSVENSKPPTEATDAAVINHTDKAPPSKEINGDSEKTVKKAQSDSSSAHKGDADAHQVFAPQPAYIMSYNTAQPSVIQSHYVSPVMPSTSQGYMFADQYAAPPPDFYYYNSVDAHSSAAMHQQQDPYNNMFSDENPNGCSVM
ncbi:heavy metal-associated isoprenylated plant protein 3-like isoform X2 [Canna indica]|uniref:Heavy metal-associated isoprenylated plant protein 3-like isoform X2 n=1 Tax=Canna indica TaxID=4628 RepID=A0AAQ3JQJ3_9LILI|nr:heavy metal-associated isoprenylated plant protein 3-like isoform X2 [Canna indica]